jgi:ankyrin repeat protein
MPKSKSKKSSSSSTTVKYAIHRAVVAHDIAALTAALSKKRANPNQLDASGHTPLHLAVHYGFFEAIPLLSEAYEY